nr:uncharacterized protein LOC129438605 [Misgurnus anguillicaudatus]
MFHIMSSSVQPKPGAQYAIAIRLTKNQCTDEKFSITSVFSKADAQIVKETIRNGQTCDVCTSPKNVIAARPQSEDPNDHSEYRLLYPVGKSPMDNLLKNVDKNSCVVFYTYNSPCVKECINGQKNILEGLSNWKKGGEGKVKINAFVFRNIWKKDLTNDLPKEFQKIDVIVPLYQCPEAEQMNCFKSRGQQTTNYCMTVQDKTFLLNYLYYKL